MADINQAFQALSDELKEFIREEVKRQVGELVEYAQRQDPAELIELSNANPAAPTSDKLINTNRPPEIENKSMSSSTSKNIQVPQSPTSSKFTSANLLLRSIQARKAKN
ncbi:MAG: hypothetical protein M3Q81_03665 [bacterium]|nr:hypothetical protein [bacterium]